MLSKERFIGMTAGATLLAAGTLTAMNYQAWWVYPAFQETVSSVFKDPESVQFRRQAMPNPTLLCGEVNAKNGYGAYNGFKRFMATHTHAVYLEGEGRVRDADDQREARLEDADVYLEALQLKTERLRSINAELRANRDPSQRELNDREAMELARARLFDKQWTEQCG